MHATSPNSLREPEGHPMWEPNEIRLLRWFMRFAGVGIIDAIQKAMSAVE